METLKAVWDATAANFFCECAAKQVGLGNRPTKFLSPTGYKHLVVDFNVKTGRNYERKQLKNRWDDLKAIFSAWVFYKIKASGLGWDDATQTITADEAQWAELIKIHKPIKTFRKGPPENFELMYKMFEKANVDGTSSMMPGVEDVAAMLKGVLSYSPRKQAMIIIACLALHNFIRDSALYDYHFARCDADEDYIPPGHVVNNGGGNFVAGANVSMDATRDSIADALMAAR